MERKYKILIGVFVGVAIVSLVGIGLLLINKQKQCELTKIEPKIDLTVLKNVASSDYRNLVNIGIYIEFFNDGFQELSLEKVSVSPGNWQTNNTRTLLLSFDCGTFIEVSLQLDVQTNLMHVETPTLSRIDAGGKTLECRLNDFYYQDNLDTRYSCHERMAFVCMRIGDNKDVATVVLEVLEFELDGDRELIKSGQFSKQPSASRCAKHSSSNK